jgi:hypothetical protein
VRPPYIDPSLFTWQVWRAGSLADLGVATRYHDIVAFRHRIRNATVGYTDGSSTLCRPKADTFSVMMKLANGEVFSTHFSPREFEAVFGEQP